MIMSKHIQFIYFRNLLLNVFIIINKNKFNILIELQLINNFGVDLIGKF